MESLIPENEYKEVDGRVYANPQIGIDESNTFIDNLRSTQDQQNEQITTDTRMLGTDVPTNLGGLTGADSYFTSRYQTPQTVANVNNLRATAQAAALNQVLENEQEIWKKKYQDAYRAYQKRQYDKANAPSSSGSGGGGDGSTKGKVEEEVVDTDDSLTRVSTKETEKDPVMDFIKGKGDWTISYTKNGKTYYANVYYQTGASGERYTGMDTSAGLSYGGQSALNYLNSIANSGGKIYGPDGKEVSPQEALTGAPGRW